MKNNQPDLALSLLVKTTFQANNDSTPLPLPKAIIWDYDGTLVATRFADRNAVAALVLENPQLASGVETFWLNEGKPIIERIRLAWPAQGKKLLPAFSQQVAPKKVDGIAELLDKLAQLNIPMAVVSSRRRKTLLWGLENVDFLKFFQVIVSVDEVSEPKPSPEGLLLASKKLLALPSEVLYIGDTLADIEAAHRAEITVWQAKWIEDTASSPQAAKPTPVLKTVAEISARLNLDYWQQNQNKSPQSIEAIAHHGINALG